jgi:spermidine synthase
MTIGFNQVHKIRAHFPLATLQNKAESAVVISFGMETTYTSLLSWDIEPTAVEFVPSAVEAFNDYHSDAEENMAKARGRIIMDDGRQFLAWNKEMFDLVTVD